MPYDVVDGKLTYQFVWDDRCTSEVTLGGEMMRLPDLGLEECVVTWSDRSDDRLFPTYPHTMVFRGTVFQHDDPEAMPERTSVLVLRRAFTTLSALVMEKNPDYRGRLRFSLQVQTEDMLRL